MKNEDNMVKCKPLADWTLAEINEYCKSRTFCGDGCTAAKAKNGVFTTCKLHYTPDKWDLSEKICLTTEERQDALAILRLFPDAESISRTTAGALEVVKSKPFPAVINRKLFPSILPGRSYDLEELLGGDTDEKS